MMCVNMSPFCLKPASVSFAKILNQIAVHGITNRKGSLGPKVFFLEGGGVNC